MTGSQKFLAIFLIGFVFAAVVAGQDNIQDLKDQFAARDDSQGGFQQDLTLEQQEEMMQAQRNKFWGCYFLTNARLYSKKKELQELFSGNKAEAYSKRVITDLMKSCLTKLQPHDSAKAMHEMRQEDFNIENWDHIVPLNIADYRGENVRLDLEAEEKYVYEYYTKMDENYRDQQEEQAEKQEKGRKQKLDYEPQIGGLSLKETSPFVKAVYTAGVLGLIAVVFFIAYKKLFSSEESPYERIKREKLARKSKKGQ